VRRWRVLLVTTILCAALALVASSPAQARSTLAKLRHARHDLRVARHHLSQYRALLQAVLAAQVVANAGSGGQGATGTTASPLPEASASPAADTSPAPAPVPSPDPAPSATPSPGPAATASAVLGPSIPAATAAPATTLTPEQLRARIAAAKALVVRLARKVGHLGHRLYVERATARGYYVPLIRDVASLNGISASGLQAMMTLESGGRATAVGGGGAYLGLFQYSPGTWHAAWNPWKACSIYDPAAQIRATARAVHLGYGPSMWANTYWRAF
jgi:type II secretory pathway pseudopilin PulG